MTKIKNYRINLRPRDVVRNLKASEGESFDISWEVNTEPLLPALKPFVKPAAIYTTLTRSTANKATPLELPQKAIAMSVIVATIGPGLAQERERVEAEGDSVRARFISAVEKEALDQSIAFGLRLITNQAKDEESELSEAFSCQDPETLHRLAALLGVERIGLNSDTQPIELPPYARLHYVIWMPAGKTSSKGATQSSSKTSSKSRMEKASV